MDTVRVTTFLAVLCLGIAPFVLFLITVNDGEGSYHSREKRGANLISNLEDRLEVLEHHCSKTLEKLTMMEKTLSRSAAAQNNWREKIELKLNRQIANSMRFERVMANSTVPLNKVFKQLTEHIQTLDKRLEALEQRSDSKWRPIRKRTTIMDMEDKTSRIPTDCRNTTRGHFTWQASDICFNKQRGVTLPHPICPNWFIMCIGNKTKAYQCLANYEFDTHKGHCVRPGLKTAFTATTALPNRTWQFTRKTEHAHTAVYINHTKVHTVTTTGDADLLNSTITQNDEFVNKTSTETTNFIQNATEAAVAVTDPVIITLTQTSTISVLINATNDYGLNISTAAQETTKVAPKFNSTPCELSSDSTSFLPLITNQSTYNITLPESTPSTQSATKNVIHVNQPTADQIVSTQEALYDATPSTTLTTLNTLSIASSNIHTNHSRPISQTIYDVTNTTQSADGEPNITKLANGVSEITQETTKSITSFHSTTYENKMAASTNEITQSTQPSTTIYFTALISKTEFTPITPADKTTLHMTSQSTIGNIMQSTTSTQSPTTTQTTELVTSNENTTNETGYHETHESFTIISEISTSTGDLTSTNSAINATLSEMSSTISEMSSATSEMSSTASFKSELAITTAPETSTSQTKIGKSSNSVEHVIISAMSDVLPDGVTFQPITTTDCTNYTRNSVAQSIAAEVTTTEQQYNHTKHVLSELYNYTTKANPYQEKPHNNRTIKLQKHHHHSTTHSSVHTTETQSSSTISNQSSASEEGSRNTMYTSTINKVETQSVPFSKTDSHGTLQTSTVIAQNGSHSHDTTTVAQNETTNTAEHTNQKNSTTTAERKYDQTTTHETNSYDIVNVTEQNSLISITGIPSTAFPRKTVSDQTKSQSEPSFGMITSSPHSITMTTNYSLSSTAKANDQTIPSNLKSFVITLKTAQSTIADDLTEEPTDSATAAATQISTSSSTDLLTFSPSAGTSNISTQSETTTADLPNSDIPHTNQSGMTTERVTIQAQHIKEKSVNKSHLHHHDSNHAKHSAITTHAKQHALKEHNITTKETPSDYMPIPLAPEEHTKRTPSGRKPVNVISKSPDPYLMENDQAHTTHSSADDSSEKHDTSVLADVGDVTSEESDEDDED